MEKTLADETKPEQTPADKPAPAAKAPEAKAPEAKAEVYVVRAVNTCYDDKGNLRNPGDIFRTTRAGLIGRECVDAADEMERKLDEDQKAIEKLRKGD